MEGFIDLHTHSYYSDGKLPPRDVIKLAYEKGLSAVALTDHDDVGGLIEAEDEAKLLGIKFLKGIEITVKLKEKKLIHILGYNMDLKNIYFLKEYTHIQKSREESIPNIVKVLQSKGVDISIDKLKERAIKEHLDRYEVFRFLMEEGYCKKAQAAWDVYLDPIHYSQEDLMDVNTAIRAIKEAGGTAILAHYNKKIGLEGYDNKQIEKYIVSFKEMGLDGLELYYPSYTEEDKIFLKGLIDKYKFKYSGGTDFHGNFRKKIDIGIGDGSLRIPYEVYENITS